MTRQELIDLIYTKWHDDGYYTELKPLCKYELTDILGYIEEAGMIKPYESQSDEATGGSNG